MSFRPNAPGSRFNKRKRGRQKERERERERERKGATQNEGQGRRIGVFLSATGRGQE